MSNLVNRVHLWKVPLEISEAELSALYPLLDKEEKRRAQQFHFDKHRRRFIVSHAYLRNILSHYLKIPASEIQFRTNESGKPYVQGTPLHFNLSHSEEMAIIGVSIEAEVGVDIEYVKNDINALDIAERFFHPDEFEQLKQAHPKKYPHYFYTCWTAKEAYLKAKGHGIANYLDKFSLNFQDPGSITITFADKELVEFKSWFVHSFPLDPDYIVTVVSTETDSVVEIHQA